MATAPKLPHGRPSVYTDEIAATICERLAAGESLRAICRDPGLPVAATVLTWAKTNPTFSEQYGSARQIGYQHLADDLLEIADDTVNDSLANEDGSPRQNGEWIARSRLRVDTRKWLLSKMLPKLYGDKLETTTKMVDENDVPVSPIEMARRIAFAFAQSGATPEQPAPSPTKQPKQP